MGLDIVTLVVGATAGSVANAVYAALSARLKRKDHVIRVSVDGGKSVVLSGNSEMIIRNFDDLVNQLDSADRTDESQPGPTMGAGH